MELCGIRVGEFFYAEGCQVGIHALRLAFPVSRPERPEHELALLATRIPEQPVYASVLPHPIAGMDMIAVGASSVPCGYRLRGGKIPLLALRDLEEPVRVGFCKQCTHVQEY
jgi:hypothetical protein